MIMKTDTSKMLELFSQKKLVVMNVGVSAFGDALARQEGVEVVQVNWKPLAGGDKEMQDLLELLGL